MHIKRHTGHLTIWLRKGVDSVANQNRRTHRQITTVMRKFIDTRKDISELAIGLLSINKMEIKHVHKNMHCLKSIKEDDDGSQPGSKVNGDHRMPWCTNISSATLGSASRA
jgi:hypothetical protein